MGIKRPLSHLGSLIIPPLRGTCHHFYGKNSYFLLIHPYFESKKSPALFGRGYALAHSRFMFSCSSAAGGADTPPAAACPQRIRATHSSAWDAYGKRCWLLARASPQRR